MSAIVHKRHTSTSTTGLNFVLSDATVDRYGDTIEPAGWDLSEFNANPITLFNHNADFPIGRWTNVEVKNGALRGDLVMAPKGTSQRIDEIHALIDAGILRSCSVGFRPIESEPRGTKGGRRYLRQQLLECSLVSVPANPSALMQAKSLGISKGVIDQVFEGQSTSLEERRARAVRARQEAERQIARIDAQQREEVDMRRNSVDTDRAVREALAKMDRAVERDVAKARRLRDRDEAMRIHLNSDPHNVQARLPNPAEYYRLIPPGKGRNDV